MTRPRRSSAPIPPSSIRAAEPRAPRWRSTTSASSTRPSFLRRARYARLVTRHSDDPHPLAFPALLLGNVALSFGPWLVRLADVGPVAAGFWRLALALPFLLLVGRFAGQPAHWPRRALVVTVLVAAVFYSLDLAAWNAGIRMTKLGNSTLFGNSGSFVFAIYGLILVHRLPSAKQAGALVLALAGAALLMSRSYELS